ncbi:oligosaccharide repeat unit polymerase [Proteiniclasticum sp. BAD-10]|uniref:Oligosaccharide repeat unit polymerase n=1 Tax=Proteiniclasticum sediminis TaxID=2804028 RepID=A0A941CMZ4_9CLOT|nr:O-antigen polymerase [Proteiniclasticum sediminis]MBR0575042.1 oligosaccharide repeat unit polymerase [Proteiniclasticum sediminis]
MELKKGQKTITGWNQVLWESLIIAVIYLIGYLLSTTLTILAALGLVASAIVLYFYYSFHGERSFLKLKAVFSGVWLFTTGIAQFQFLSYQEPWSSTTWLNMGLAHVTFVAGINLSATLFPSIENFLNGKVKSKAQRKFQIGSTDEKLFLVATVSSIIGILAFVANVMIKGYIPFFVINTNQNAYVDFYSRVHVFFVASLASVGVSFYCLINCTLAKWKKVTLAVYMFILVLVIPTLLVQRGAYIIASIVLTASIYAMSSKKFWVLIICGIFIVSGYLAGSSLRGYSDAQLAAFFPTKDAEPSPDDEEITANPGINFQISPKLSFLYSYLTVSHDNFNSLVEQKTESTYGLYQIKPFNVVLRSSFIDEELEVQDEKLEDYRVLHHLTTFNLISMAYMDFGTAGVFLFTLLWSFAFGLVETYYNRYKGPFSIAAYAVCLVPTALSFFDPWMSNFVPWLLWGTVFLMFLGASLTRKRQPKLKND